MPFAEGRKPWCLMCASRVSNSYTAPPSVKKAKAYPFSTSSSVTTCFQLVGSPGRRRAQALPPRPLLTERRKVHGLRPAPVLFPHVPRRDPGRVTPCNHVDGCPPWPPGVPATLAQGRRSAPHRRPKARDHLLLASLVVPQGVRVRDDDVNVPATRLHSHARLRQGIISCLLRLWYLHCVLC